MKLDDAHREDISAAFQSSAMTAQPRYRDEDQQEQMRRLHNARASQRAARLHRVNRLSAT
jgi:hypothetical protein